jgi:hypothetical protein
LDFKSSPPFSPLQKRLKKIVKITSIFDNFRIFGVDSTHNELRDQLTSVQRNIVGTNIKNITNIDTSQTLCRKIGFA